MNITEFLALGIYAVAMIMSVMFIPWLRERLGNEGYEQMLRFVDVAVAAAEQLYDVMDGAKKKRYVLDYLESKGYEVDSQDLDVAIEAAVKRLHHELYGGEARA